MVMREGCPCCLSACACIAAAAIVPPAVTREKGNPLTLALQSALVPAQVGFCSVILLRCFVWVE
jgi:hypothetical protein